MAKQTKNNKLIEQLTDQMNDRIQSYQEKPEEELELLNYMRKFYKYSIKNTMMIESQYRGAYGVASYKEHQKNGYQVQKGQKAIRIMAPVIKDRFINEQGKIKDLRYATKREKELIKKGKLEVIRNDVVSFRAVPVFDITQTDCPVEDYPKLYPNRPQNFEFKGSLEQFNNFYQAINEYAENKNINIAHETMSDGAQKGYYAPNENRIALRDDLSIQEQAKVLLHEIGHAEMHNHRTMKDKDKELQTTPIKEYQAEMLAYLVSSTFELDTEDYSIRYLNNWTSKADIKPETYKQSIEEVKEVAKNLIENVVERFNQLELTKERPEPKNELESRIEKLREKHSQKENSGNTKQLNQERVK